MLLSLNEGLEFKDPKRAQNLSLSTTDIHQNRCNIVLLSFFLAIFPSYKNQSIDLKCNQLTGFYMREYCHEKGQ